MSSPFGGTEFLERSDKDAVEPKGLGGLRRYPPPLFCSFSLGTRRLTGVFYRSGLIEQRGRGTQKIIELCKMAGHPAPDFEEIAGSVVVTFRPASGSITPKPTAEVTTQVATQVTTEVERLLPLCSGTRTKKDLLDELGLRNASHFRKAYLSPALANGLIEMTIPDKPNSRLQKYRLTAKGQAWLAAQQSKK